MNYSLIFQPFFLEKVNFQFQKYIETPCAGKFHPENYSSLRLTHNLVTDLMIAACKAGLSKCRFSFVYAKLSLIAMINCFLGWKMEEVACS